MKRLAGFLLSLAMLLGSADVLAQAAPAPFISMSFSPTTIAPGAESTLQLNIQNPSSTSAISSGSIASFTYAAGVVNAPDPQVFPIGCGSPTITATPGAGSLSASGINIGFLGTCSIFVNVTASAGGAYTSVFPPGGFVGSTGPNANTASATLTVTAPLVVTNQNDSGAGSLRQAILDANANCASGPWTITFNVPTTGEALILPTSPLPALMCPNTRLDGYTQPGSSPNTVPTSGGFNAAIRVDLNGTSCSGCNGITIGNDGILVRGLLVRLFGGAGIQVSTPSPFNTVYVQGNHITNNTPGIRLSVGHLVLGGTADADANRVNDALGSGGILVQSNGSLEARHNLIANNTGNGISFVGVTSQSEVINNTLQGNTQRGISVDAGTTAPIVMFSNSAFFNGGPGIDLGANGPTANDEASVPYDTDSGPNNLLNHPVITSVTHSGTDTVVQGYLKTAPTPGGVADRVELWDRNVPPDPGVTEGETLIATFALPLDANGFGSFNVTIPNRLAQNVSAQVTVDTCADACFISSEFSPSVAAAVPSLTVAPASLAFGQQPVGTTSAGQVVTLTNNGAASLTFTSITTSASFGKTTTCGAALAPSASCTVTVTFTPGAGGNISGTLQVVSDDPGSPHSVTLQGTGVTPPTLALSFNPSSIPLGSNSTLTTTISNPNTVAATNIAFTIVYNPAFGNAVVPNLTNTCSTGSNTSAAPGGGSSSWSGLSVAPGGSCTVSIDITPTSTGSGTVTVPFGAMTSDQGSNTSTPTATLTVTAAPAPDVLLSTTAIDFGSVTENTTSAPQAIVIKNTGTGNLVIATASVSGEFSRVAPFCDGVVLAPGATCAEQVTFTPLSPGAKTGTWTLVSNAPTSPHTVSLAGQGIAALVPAVTLSPASLTFAPQTVGTTSAPQTVTLSNTGTGPLSIASISTTGDFSKSAACPATLAAGSSCTVTVTFTPVAVGGRIGELKVSSDAAGSPHAVSLSGTGAPIPVPVVTLSAASLGFPDTIVGNTSTARVVVVTNTGSAPLTIDGVVGNSGEFPFGSSCAGATLAPSASCDITVQFQPGTAGARSGTIQILSNASGSPHTLSLSGIGVAVAVGILTASPASLAFGNVVVGQQSAPQTITLTNSGNATVSVSRITLSAPFVLGGSCPTVAPGASCGLTVRFAPTSLGAASGTLTIQSNATAATITVPLTGTGVANPLPEATLSATSLGFGNRFVALPSAGQVITLTNTGLAPLAITAISILGDFNQANNCPATLASAASCQITVRMFARLAGPRLGVLRVATNAAGSPATVELTGTGCTVVTPARARLGVTMSCAPGG